MRENKTVTYEKAFERAANICGKAEHCSSEMLDKLRGWGVTTDAAKKIIDKLRDLRYIDDRRFAIAYASDKMRFSYWGKRKIAYMLTCKRIPSDIITDALGEIADDEYIEIIKKSLKQKSAGLDLPLSLKDKNTLYRFAVSRGYEGQIAVKVIKELEK